MEGDPLAPAAARTSVDAVAVQSSSPGARKGAPEEEEEHEDEGVLWGLPVDDVPSRPSVRRTSPSRRRVLLLAIRRHNLGGSDLGFPWTAAASRCSAHPDDGDRPDPPPNRPAAAAAAAVIVQGITLRLHVLLLLPLSVVASAPGGLLRSADVDAVHERDADPDGARHQAQHGDDQFRSEDGHRVEERVTDAAVAVDRYRDHDERRKRYVRRDEELVETTQEIERHHEFKVFYVDGVRYDDETRHEIDERQNEDEQRRNKFVFLLREDVHHQGVARSTRDAQYREDRHDNVH